MRNDIILGIHERMKEDKNVYFLTGDLGYGVLDDMKNEFPDRFINVGIAEQNMMGIATGLALTGKKVFVYSIIPFATMRCFEQIRNDVCYHDVDVTILGAGSGLSYGILSSTHFALEDIAILRSLPNMTIFSPSDRYEAVEGLKYFQNFKHPLYFRIGKKDEPEVYDENTKFNLREGMKLRDGKDGVILSTGAITSEVVKAADILKEKYKICLSLYNISIIKPIKENHIFDKCLGKKLIFTVEEHGVVGGLGSVVVEALSEVKSTDRIIRLGTKDFFIKTVGTQNFLRKKLGLDCNGIVKKIRKYY